VAHLLQTHCHTPTVNAEWFNKWGGCREQLDQCFSVARALSELRQNCVVLLGCLVAVGAMAASEDPNIDRSPVPDSSAVAAIDQLRLSDVLADFGERNADPMALVEAAKIRKMLPAPLNGSKEAPDLAWEPLLARAAQIAGPDPLVGSFIADVRHLKLRDIPVIPLEIKLVHKQVKQNGANRAEVRFLAGELAVVYVRPVGGGSLDLFVYDDLNNLICSGGASAQGPQCRWRPRRDGSYLIDVRNNSASEVEYELAINRETVTR
jgi:hypothetical protein